MWKFEVFKDPDDDSWRWRLVMRNTLIVVESSDRFSRRSDALRAAEVAREEIGAAVVEAV